MQRLSWQPDMKRFTSHQEVRLSVVGWTDPSTGTSSVPRHTLTQPLHIFTSLYSKYNQAEQF